MSEILAHADAAKAVPLLLNRIDEIKAELADLEKKKSNQPSISAIHQSELERDIGYNVTEIEVLKSAVPEGYMEDENVQYFLAVAEIQKSNEVLRQQLQFSQRNLESLNSDIKETQELAQNLVEVNEELSAANKRREEERKKVKAAENLLNPEERKNAKYNKLKKEEQDLTIKIRSTIESYKEVKNFLQHILPKIAPAEDEESDSHLAMLLQYLWNVFFNNGALIYTNISSLEFDVDEKDLKALVQNYIIEANPKNKDEIRMVDFTH